MFQAPFPSKAAQLHLIDRLLQFRYKNLKIHVGKFMPVFGTVNSYCEKHFKRKMNGVECKTLYNLWVDYLFQRKGNF